MSESPPLCLLIALRESGELDARPRQRPLNGKWRYGGNWRKPRRF